LGTRCRVVGPIRYRMFCQFRAWRASVIVVRITQWPCRITHVVPASPLFHMYALSCQPQQSRKRINHNHCNCIALKFIFKQMIRYKCLKPISLKLTVRATFAALKLQIPVLPYLPGFNAEIKSKINSSVWLLIETTHVTEFEFYVTCNCISAEIYFLKIWHCNNASNGEPAYVMVFDIGCLPRLVILFQTLLVLLHISAE